jgi:glucosamine kinase
MFKMSCGRTSCVSFFLGIDGGGSKTLAVIGDDKSVLGSGRSGPSNVVRIGEAQARQAIMAAINSACAEAHIKPSEIAGTCVGIAGAARPEIAEIVRRIVSESVSGAVQVVGDMVIALEAAFGSGQGVIVIAGTGSIAYGRNAAGKTARAGGWGFAISDEGSAHWIGRAAIAAVMRVCDEKPALLASLMKPWHVHTLDELVLAANASPPPDFAALFPLILSAAESGDPFAREVLLQAGEELARLAETVIRQLFRQGENVQVAIAGGVFRNAVLVREVFYNHLRASHPGVKGRETLVDPVQGALAMARRGISAEKP